MDVMVTVNVRRLLAKHINKAVELTVQLTGNLFERQSILLRQFPNPLTQLSVASQTWHLRKRHPKRQHKVHADAQRRNIAAQLRRVFNRFTINQCRCGGHDPPTAGFNNAVVLTSGETKIISIDDQQVFHCASP